LRAWLALPEPAARLALQGRTEGPEAKEELVQQQQELEARGELEEPARPVRQPEKSRRKIRRKRSPIAEEHQGAISWTNPPGYIDEQDLQRFDEFMTKDWKVRLFGGDGGLRSATRAGRRFSLI
jgi:hypothetical protein